MITMMKERNPMRMMQQKEEGEVEEEDQEDEKKTKTKKNEQREEIYEEKKLLVCYTREDVSKSSFDYRRWARVERGTLFASGREQSVGTI